MKNPALSFDLSNDPEYAKATALLTSLKQRAADLDAERSDLIDQLRERRKSAAIGIDADVAVLLGDEVEDSAAPGGITARLTEITTQADAVRRAIDVAASRQGQARHAASVKICAALRPEYEKRVSAVATALLAAHRAHLDLSALADELTDANVAWTANLEPMQAHRIFGDPRDNQSATILWLRSAVAAGFVDRSSIPVEMLA